MKHNPNHKKEYSIMYLNSVAVRTLLICAVALAPLAADQAPQTISITAERFHFTPNEITVKKGEPVVLEIQSKDVTHGLLIKDLGVRQDVKKGQNSEITFTPQTVGTFEGKCAHFCGSGHGSMKFTVHVTE
jgi:cytochrome c oxidase subunit II